MSNFKGGLDDGNYGENNEYGTQLVIKNGERKDMWILLDYVPFDVFFNKIMGNDNNYGSHRQPIVKSKTIELIKIAESLTIYYDDLYVAKIMIPTIKYCYHICEEYSQIGIVPKLIHGIVHILTTFVLRWNYNMATMNYDFNQYLPIDMKGVEVKWDNRMTANNIEIFKQMKDSQYVEKNELMNIWERLKMIDCNKCFMESKCIELNCSHYFCIKCAELINRKCPICLKAIEKIK